MDDQLATGVTRREVGQGRGRLAQRVRPADDGPDLAGLDKLGQRQQPFTLLCQPDAADVLRHYQGQQRPFDEDDARTAEPALPELATVRDQCPVSVHHPHQLGQRVPEDVVE